MPVKITSRLWGRHHDEDVFLFKIENEKGAYAEITNYGATVVAVVAPDKDGQLGHVITGFPELEGYLQDNCYIGSTIGRYANRIADAKFDLDGQTYHLEANDGENNNHAGKSGFNFRVFNWVIVGDTLQMTLHSADGDGGFPGNLYLTVTYSWNDKEELFINYKATTDKPTIANFTNHAYFNLLGFQHKIYNHRLKVNSSLVLHAWDNYVASGAVIPAGDKAFNNDKLSDKFKIGDEQVTGLNLFYIIDGEPNEQGLTHAATLSEEITGRTLGVYTNYPGVFLYTGDYLNSTLPTHTGKPSKPFEGLCLECQHYPDSINHANFPQAVLRPGETYNQTILFKFGLL